MRKKRDIEFEFMSVSANNYIALECDGVQSGRNLRISRTNITKLKWIPLCHIRKDI
jgi:hypothetical protein